MEDKKRYENVMIFPDRMPPEQAPVWWIIVHDNQLIDTTPDGPSFQPPLLPVEAVPYATQAYTAEIGQYKGHPVFLLIANDDMPFHSGWTFLPLRQCILRSDKDLFGLSARGCQIAGFLDTHKFCGRCGEQVAQHRS